MTQKSTVLAVVLSLLVVAPTAGVIVFSGEASAAANLSITLMETEGRKEIDAVAPGQPIRVHLQYSGFGSGSHTIEIIEQDAVASDTLATLTVNGNSGERTLTISSSTLEEAMGFGDRLPTIQAQWAGEDSNIQELVEADTTMYLRDVPETVAAGESITLEYYGWTGADAPSIYLFEDDPPLNDNYGEDETIRAGDVQTNGNYFEGTFTFTPSEYITVGEDSDNVLEVQLRPNTGTHVGAAWSGSVREIRVTGTAPPDTSVDTPTPAGSQPTTSQQDSGGAPELVLTAQRVTTRPGEEARIQFTLTNKGSATAANSGIQNRFEEWPSGWASTSISDGDGDWGDSGDWSVSNLQPGESSSGSFTLAIPAGEDPGAYSISMDVIDSDGNVVDTVSTTINVQQVNTPTPTPPAAQTPTPTATDTATPTETAADTQTATTTPAATETPTLEPTNPQTPTAAGAATAAQTEASGPGFNILIAVLAIVSAVLASAIVKGRRGS